MNYLKICILFIGFACCIGCKQTVEKENLHYLNGYWEIEKVVGKNNETKVYKVNTTIEYISINDSLQGNRRKVKPVIGGKYQTNGNEESIEIIQENNTFYIDYKNDQNNWKETLIELNEDHFTTQNNTSETKFYYKRYQPITVE